MKYCPKCKNQFTDESLKYCLADGTPLVSNNPEAPTLRKPEEPIAALRIMGSLDNVIPARVEYILKKEWVDEGATFDFKASTNAARITVKGLVETTFKSGEISEGLEWGAAIQVSGDMGRMYGGEQVLREGVDFLIPITLSGEEKRSIVSFYARRDILLFFRILVEQINSHHRRVELNIAYLWYGGSD
jgi:hypothetical protein